MFNSSQNSQHAAPRRCVVCEGPFGLIRYHSWRTPLCFKEVCSGSQQPDHVQNGARSIADLVPGADVDKLEHVPREDAIQWPTAAEMPL
jgi:hypothetical protein